MCTYHLLTCMCVCVCVCVCVCEGEGEREKKMRNTYEILCGKPVGKGAI